MTTKQLQTLIKWLRAERISFSTISAGGITLDGVVDLKMAEFEPAKPEPDRPSMYERYGADLLRQPSAKASDMIPDEALSDG